MNNFLKTMIDHYGAPDWDKGGRNPKMIEREYDEVLEKFHPDQIKALAKDCIKFCEKFPSVAAICKVIEKHGYKPLHDKSSGWTSEELKCHKGVMEDYLGFAKWYNRIMHRNKEASDMFNHVLIAERNRILMDHLREYEKLNKTKINQYDHQTNTVWGLFFQDVWHTQVERRIEELNESNRKATFSWLKRIKNDPPKGNTLGAVCARLCIEHMPDEVKQELVSA